MRVFKDVQLVEQLGSGMERIMSVYDKSIFEFLPNFLRVNFYFDKDVLEYLNLNNENKYGTVNVSSYNEMIQATEAIIRFKNFMSHFDICEKFYIYYKNRRIYPSNFSFQSSEVVRKSAIDQFNRIEKEEQD